MNSPLLKKLLPHGVALVVFLLVSILFCRPVLEGNVLNQHDIIGWKGMAQNAFDYKAQHGHFPLWNPNLFSGMPNYQVAMEGKTILPDMTRILSLGLPKPINFFFLACIGFYVLCLALRIRPVVGMLVSLGYAFSTYNAVIIFAGHESQMMATAFLPVVLAGIISTYEKNYWLGLALTSFGAYQQIAVNHLQISYYFFLIALLVTLGYAYTWIRNGEWKHLMIAGAITAFSGILGVAGSALVLKTTAEYTPYTMRGGKDLTIEGDTVMAIKTKGLDTGYAFVYSLGKTETATLLMGNSFGGGSQLNMREGSKVASKLIDRGVPENNAEQLAQSLPRYWGDLPYTAGPAYLGVIICLLGLIGFFVVRSPLRWGLLAATVLGIFMSWGKNFASFNVFLFEYLPLYNKFRAPSMAQVIPQVTMTIMAALALNHLLFGIGKEATGKETFKKVLYTLGGLTALLGVLYIGMSYSSPIDAQILANKWDNSGTDEIGRLLVSGLKEERKAMFGGQVLRTLAFAALLLGTIYLYWKSKIRPMVAAGILLFISTAELTMVSHAYLNDESYVSADEYENKNFAPDAIDKQLLADKDPNFRVFNVASDTYNESRTSYYHKSVGGYHPAKLRIYQDIIEKYLSRRPEQGVLNMLNTKYVIVQNPQRGTAELVPNPEAFGPCWLVKHVSFADDRVKAITALGKTNLRDTAIVEKSFSQLVTQPQPDSASSITMVKFDNDAIEYEANCNGPQFAVFSEIYYPKGWNAYLDGKKVEYVNTNYILRGLSVPAGKHSIKFVFEPASVKQGRNIMFIASILVAIVFLGGLFMAWKGQQKSSAGGA